MSTRQTLRDFLISAGSTATGISLPVDPGPDGIVGELDDLGVEPNTGRPLLDFATGESLLGDYTSFITERNEYQIAPGAHEAPASGRGSSIPAAESTSALNVFADSNIRQNADALNRSNSAVFDQSGVPLSSIVDKTGAGGASNGNTLLTDVVPAPASSDLAPEQSRAVVGAFASLKKYNTFSPTDDPPGYSIDTDGNTIDTKEYISDRKARVQIGRGTYEPETVEVSADVSQDDLSNIARSMILKAAGWDQSETPGEAQDPSKAFSDVTSNTLARFPSLYKQQSSVEPFRARDAFGAPENSDGSSFLDGRGDAVQRLASEAEYSRTRGSTHTPDQPFGESQSKPASERIQSLQAGIAILGLCSFIDNKLININSYIQELQVSNDSVLRGPYYMGTSVKSKVTTKTRALIRTFMFQTGIYSYTSCVSEGLYSCFGFKSLQTSVQPIQYDTPQLAEKYKSEIENIAKNLGKPYFSSSMGMSQGFWRAVSESALRSLAEFSRVLNNVSIGRSGAEIDGSDFVACLLSMKDSLAVKIINVFASIGYQRLVIQGITTAEAEQDPGSITNPYGMDEYPDAPGTRQMKSRDGRLLSNSSLAWRNSCLPSLFILPVEAMAATFDLDYMFDAEKGSNPIKGMLGSTLYDKTYARINRNSGVIPPIVARIIENRLSAEYVPFYFRDLRTNEIVAFHAFLESLTDGFSANFTETKGFGRADPVQNYSSTTRTIGLTFNIVATSKEDFDEMWFKINKLTTLVYPQYTRGRTAQTNDDSTPFGKISKQTVRFEQPFSQIAGGTPVVRLRVGDLVKTNYSRYNFAKLFGVGNDTFGASYPASGDNLAAGATQFIQNVANTTQLSSGGKLPSFDVRLLPFLVYTASPLELTSYISMIKDPFAAGVAQAAADFGAELTAYYLKNGFVNPLLNTERENFFQNRDKYLLEESVDEDASRADREFIGLRSKLILKARSTPYIVTRPDGKTQNLRLRRPINVRAIERYEGRTGTVYELELNDYTLSDQINGSKCKVSAADLYVDSGSIVDIAAMPGMLLSLGLVSGFSGVASSIVSNILTSATDKADVPVDLPLADFLGSIGRTFTSPYLNPITKAFEDRMGEGLAGVIKNMTFTWMDTAAWEMDWNSRAPMACKVQITFNPIHDIAPGLDSNGFNRAPIYNVGQIMHDTAGSPMPDGGMISRRLFKDGGAVAETAVAPGPKISR